MKDSLNLAYGYLLLELHVDLVVKSSRFWTHFKAGNNVAETAVVVDEIEFG